MKSNNLIDLKKAKRIKKDNTDKENEYLADLQLDYPKKQEKVRREAVSKVDLLFNRFNRKDESEIYEKNKKFEESKISRNVFFSSAVNSFWLKLGKFFLYTLIFLLPIFFLPTTIYPVDANKQFLAIVLVSASFICYLADAYFTRKFIYSKSTLIFSAVFFVIAAGISALFSISPSNSFFGDFIQADVLINFIIGALALYLSAVFFKKEDFNKIGSTFLASVILVSFFGLLQLLGFYIFPFDFTKQAGFNVFGSVINFDIFIAFSLVMIIAALTELEFDLKTKIILIAAALLISINLVLINYQQIWILLAIIMVLYAVYKFSFRSDESNVSSIGSSIPLVIGIVAFLFALVGPSLSKVISLPNLPVDVKPNFSSTMNISLNTLKGLRSLTGTGLATFSSQYSAYRPVELNQSSFWKIKFNQGFSFVTTYLTTAGFIGILSILILIFAYGRLAIKNIQDKKAVVISMGILFMVLGWFLYPIYFVGFIFSFIALGLLASIDSSPRVLIFSSAPKIQTAISFIILIFFAGGMISLLYYSGKKYIAASYFKNGLNEYNLANVSKSVEKISKAISFDSRNDQYLRSASLLLLMDAEKSRNMNIEMSKDENFINKIDNALKLAKNATEINPIEFENWYNLGDVYEKIITIADGADNSAVINYQKAADLNPKNPDPLIGQAKILMYKARLAKSAKEKEENLQSAIDALKKSIDLKSDYAVGHFQLALAYVQASRSQEAIDEFELTKLLSDPDTAVSFQLGMLYFNMNDFEKAKNEMEKAVSSDPDFSNARYVLGVIYDKKREKDNAIVQFENVLRLNPENAEVKKILENLKTNGMAFADNKPLDDESLGLPGEDNAEMINIEDIGSSEESQ